MSFHLSLLRSNSSLFCRTSERFKTFCILPAVKHGGGSLMILAAISAPGVAPLERIFGKMDQKDRQKSYYFKILKNI